MNTCKISVYKKCTSCGVGFCDNLWCGDLLCQRCLDICWILDDDDLCAILFTCCDHHRPQINFNNITAHSYMENEPQILELENAIQKERENEEVAIEDLPTYKTDSSQDEYTIKDIYSTSKSKPIPIPKNDSLDKKDKFDNNPFSQSFPSSYQQNNGPVKSQSFILAKSYEVKNELSSTFKKYIIDKIKNKEKTSI
jgi:hypothetical protein